MTADTVLSLGYFSLSARQLLVLLVGGSALSALWIHSAWLASLLPPIGAILHGALLVLCGSAMLALAFGQAAGRSLDAWAIVLLAYAARPRCCLWKSIRWEWDGGQRQGHEEGQAQRSRASSAADADADAGRVKGAKR